MATLTFAQVYALARSTGLDRDKAIIATAIARSESGLDPSKVGDTRITTAKWGPSVGLWQIRSLKAETGTGRDRDITRLKDPVFNARSMFDVSSGGRNWEPWTDYGNEKYRAHLAAAEAAAAGSTSTPEVTSPTYPAAGGSTVSVVDGKSPFDVDVNLGPLSGPVEGLIEAAGPILLGGLIVAGGAALVVAGLAKAAK